MTQSALKQYEELLHTAGLQLDTSAKAGSAEHTKELAGLYAQAVARWGLGLHHLPHTVTQDGDELYLVSGKTKIALSNGAQNLAHELSRLQAPGEHGLSDWAALSEGWRAQISSRPQLKVLIEDARDFETHWAALRGGVYYRVWRQTKPADGEVLSIEVCRPVNAAELLSDAAWDVITSIKDRAFARDLMERSKKGGILEAVLSARHKGAGAALEQNFGAHFTVQSVITELHGAQARDMEAYQQALKEAATQLAELQQAAVSATAAILRSELR